MAETKAEKGMMGTTAHGGIVVVKNKQEWLESRKDLKGRKKRGAKEGRASDEPAAFGFPMGGSGSRSSASSATSAAGGEAQETDETATDRRRTS